MVVGAVLFTVGALCGTTVLRPQCHIGRLQWFIGADLVYLGLCGRRVSLAEDHEVRVVLCEYSGHWFYVHSGWCVCYSVRVWDVRRNRILSN
jgi:hypothetical protein